jgi:prepilin-type processing-associated H-X9-DG protein
MTWTVSGGTYTTIGDISNTNVDWATHGLLADYTAKALGIYKCPADVYLSPQQRKAEWSRRLRSISMNGLFGYSGEGPTATGRSAWFPGYRQFLKQTDFLQPAQTWLMVDEHPDSINEGRLLVGDGGIDVTAWGDTPASYHNGACGFSFADGHAEIHKWRSRTSIWPVTFNWNPVPFDALGQQDFQWYKEHTGYKLYP